MMNNRIEPRRASRRWCQNPVGETLGEDLASAKDSVASEAASDHLKVDNPSRKRKIGHTASVSAVNAPGRSSARWTTTSASRRPYRNDNLITFEGRTLYNKPTRHQSRALECLLHGADSPPIKAPDIPQTASKVSQSQIWEPI